MSKSPAAIVKEKFGDKAKLVAALGPFTNDDLWVKRVNESKGLERVSSAKLLHLFEVFTAVKEKFGTRGKLVDTICELEKRTKDEGYKQRLLGYPVPRLYDAYRAAARRSAKAAAPKAKSAAVAKAAPKPPPLRPRKRPRLPKPSLPPKRAESTTPCSRPLAAVARGCVDRATPRRVLGWRAGLIG